MLILDDVIKAKPVPCSEAHYNELINAIKETMQRIKDDKNIEGISEKD